MENIKDCLDKLIAFVTVLIPMLLLSGIQIVGYIIIMLILPLIFKQYKEVDCLKKILKGIIFLGYIYIWLIFFFNQGFESIKEYIVQMKNHQSYIYNLISNEQYANIIVCISIIWLILTTIPSFYTVYKLFVKEDNKEDLNLSEK